MLTSAENFDNLVQQKQALVGIVGLGYVGLPLCRVFHDAGFAVLGVDSDPGKIEKLRRGESYLNHLGAEFVSNLMSQGAAFEATDDHRQLARADAILICVPTPLDQERQPDLSFVLNTTDAIASVLRPGQLVCLESTTYPGTTRLELAPRLGATGLKLGEDFFLAFSPEREDPGRQDQSTQMIPKLVGATDEASLDAALCLYRAAFAEIVAVESAEVAEAAKLLENIYRAVNIAMVNEMKIVLEAMGIDIWSVIKAASTKPFGFEPFYPGPGLGGHCIPIDPFYLSYRAAQVGCESQFIELAGRINCAMPSHVISSTRQALENRGVQLDGARVLVLGLAYKPNVDDVRESPSFELIAGFARLGACVDYHDPLVSETHRGRNHDLKMQSIELTDEAIASYDAIVIATAHDGIDYHRLGDHARLIIDTRNAMQHYQADRANIIKA